MFDNLVFVILSPRGEESLISCPVSIASRRRGNLGGGVFPEILQSLRSLRMTESERRRVAVYG